MLEHPDRSRATSDDLGYLIYAQIGNHPEEDDLGLLGGQIAYQSLDGCLCRYGIEWDIARIRIDARRRKVRGVVQQHSSGPSGLGSIVIGHASTGNGEHPVS